jgi:hemerythrin-like domain-containing protein
MANGWDGDQAVWAFEEHEHRDLLRGINRIHDAACGVGRQATPILFAQVLDIIHWLDQSFAPHTAWEEGWLFPEIDSRIDTPWATRMARLDHQQIREMAQRLRDDHNAPNRSQTVDKQAELRYHLFGLEVLLRAHIEREERFLIPMLNDVRGSIIAPPGPPG